MFCLIWFLVLATTAFGTIIEDETTGIINGELATIEDFPYYAFIAYNETELLCGGAFIERDIVLTAAHCTLNGDLTIYPGITTLRDLKRSKGYKIKNGAVHEEFAKNYDEGFFVFSLDVGLIKLTEKIELGDHAQLIELATEAPPIGEEATVVGFGMEKCEGKEHCDKSKRPSKHLRSTQIVIESIEEGIIATQSRGNRNTCFGDSGGPITYDGKVIGVVSSGQYADCTGFDIQAPVFTMLDWIAETKAEL
ncbi:hypothetical protein Trydic_g17521 [Trypoxylus dichotomus]